MAPGGARACHPARSETVLKRWKRRGRLSLRSPLRIGAAMHLHLYLPKRLLGLLGVLAAVTAVSVAADRTMEVRPPAPSPPRRLPLDPELQRIRDAVELEVVATEVDESIAAAVREEVERFARQGFRVTVAQR